MTDTNGRLDDATLRTIADDLWQAETSRQPIPPLTSSWPDMHVDDAYRVQDFVTQGRLDRGEQVVGYKIGLTSVAMQKMMGVDEPDSGYLFASQLVDSHTELPCSEMCQPRVEFEIAFLLGEEVAGPGCTAAQVMAATDSVAPSIEVIDSRIEEWKVRLADTVADNGSAARVVMGPQTSPATITDLALTGVVVRKNGKVVETGAGGAVLGHPAIAIAWLANRLAAHGRTLEAGSIVLPGSCTRAFPVGPGDVVAAEFDRLGSVVARFGH